MALWLPEAPGQWCIHWCFSVIMATEDAPPAPWWYHQCVSLGWVHSHPSCDGYNLGHWSWLLGAAVVGLLQMGLHLAAQQRTLVWGQVSSEELCWLKSCGKCGLGSHGHPKCVATHQLEMQNLWECLKKREPWSFRERPRKHIGTWCWPCRRTFKLSGQNTVSHPSTSFHLPSASSGAMWVGHRQGIQKNVEKACDPKEAISVLLLWFREYFISFCN